MRRRDRQINDREEIINILKKGFVCHLAMCANNEPYVVPMIYVYHDDCLYFHCAEVGLKLDIIRQNSRVCFQVETHSQDSVENAGTPCDWGFAYESAIGFGNAQLIEDDEEKKRVYDLLVAKIAPSGYIHGEDPYVPKKIRGTYIIKVPSESVTGKRWDGTKPVPKKP